MSYDAFFSHSNSYKNIVENIAIHIEDNYQLKIFLDKWYLIPGEKWIQELEQALNNTNTCVVFLASENSTGWFEDEVELALNIQSSKRNEYRIIPVLLPSARNLEKGNLLSTRTQIDLRDNTENEYELYRLACGIKGVAPGRYIQQTNDDLTKNKLRKLQEYYSDGLIENEVLLEYQLKLLDGEFE